MCVPPPLFGQVAVRNWHAGVITAVCLLLVGSHVGKSSRTLLRINGTKRMSSKPLKCMDTTMVDFFFLWINQFRDKLQSHSFFVFQPCFAILGGVERMQLTVLYPTITYYWTVPLILDHSYLVGNLTNSKIAETKALEPLILTLLYQQFSNLLISPRRYEWSKIREYYVIGV